MGKRHVGYGVTKALYDIVGAALLDTQAKGLGDDFTPETEEAWTITCTTLATVMKNAAYGETEVGVGQTGVDFSVPWGSLR